MPGMMDTVLNLGLNDATVEALAKNSGDKRFADDSYRRFITMYSDVVIGLGHHHFEEISTTTRTGMATRSTPISRPMTGSIWSAATRSGSRRSTERRSRRTRMSSCGARSAPYSGPG